MRNKIYILITLLILAISANAHPLGNFTINQYSRLEVEKSQIKIRQILDIAEIPAFQLKSEIDADQNGEFSDAELNAYAAKITTQFLSNLSLNVNNQPLELRAESKNASLKNGEGNLPTIKIEWNLVGDLVNTNAVNQVNFENKNYGERIGWNEIVVNQINNIKVFNSTAFGSGITDELKAYPQENLNAPLAERKAAFSFTASDLPPNSKPLQNRDGHANSAVQKDKFAELISVPEITPAIALVGLLIAFGFGAMHAMSPGHGKTVVGAYLVGSRGTFKHAMFLGLTVTITHTLGVFALGLVTLFASSYILPEKIMPFLSFFSGLIVLYIGLTMFKNRLFAALGSDKSGHHSHSHDGHEHHSHNENSHEHHSHDDFTHTHDGHTHSHLPPEEISWKSLLGLGISGGLLPCPSALVLMLSAINLGRIGYGLILTTAFSFGLAATLTAVGLIFLYGGKLFTGSKLAEYRIVKTLPVFSAFVIACLGAVICYNSL
jgi:nickel/cobalt transporter (NicO) family protein